MECKNVKTTGKLQKAVSYNKLPSMHLLSHADGGNSNHIASMLSFH